MYFLLFFSLIFLSLCRDDQSEAFTEHYNAAIKAFILTLVKIHLRKQKVSFGVIDELFTKVDIDEFIGN